MKTRYTALTPLPFLKWLMDCTPLVSMLPRSVILLVDSNPYNFQILKSVAAEFGWAVEQYNDINNLRATVARCHPLAVFFDPRELGLPAPEAIREMVRLAGDVLPIVCQRFGDPYKWSQLSAAGAFHALWDPFHPNEVRQALSFVWTEHSVRENRF